MSRGARIRIGDACEALRRMRAGTVQTCVTSPPYYGLRDYGVAGQIGLEPTPEAYVARLVAVFREVRRVLRDDGTLWLNLGDSYAGSWGNQGRKETRGTQRPIHGPMLQNLEPYPAKQSCTGKIPEGCGLKPKDLIGIPWRVAFALQADGWYLRSDIIWHKPNPMPESVRDRPTKSHEYLFLLAKNERYFYDADAAKEQATGRGSGNVAKSWGNNECVERRHGAGAVEVARGVPWSGSETRNRRTVWMITPRPFRGAHFATFPPALVEPCILAGSRRGDLVLDPFHGAGTTALVAREHGRRYVGIEINPAYVALSEARLAEVARRSHPVRSIAGDLRLARIGLRRQLAADRVDAPLDELERVRP